ncbi:hypothetical protein [Microbacterium sp. USHLN272]|uniref:hypothetical protein n=1 Tax=Microbacterium sp. USHLN272 TaxID=3081287 RepID=UPI0030167EE3
MKTTLTPIFLNVDLAAALCGLTEMNISDVLDRPRGLIGLYYELARGLERYAEDLGIPELQALLLTDAVAPGALVSVQQAFYFKRTTTADGPRIEFHGKLNTDASIRVEGTLDPSRFAYASAHNLLSRRTNVEIIGQVVEVGEVVRIRPVFVGTRGYGLTEAEQRLGITHHVDRRIHPGSVDSFSAIDWATLLTADEVAATAEVDEYIVKQAIASLLHEFDVPKDWGGETSDLYSLNLRVNGRAMSSAWLLKGKSVRRPMKVPDLGKNGDQIVRLATEPAELLVVQSNQGQTAAVQSTLRAFAHDMQNPRWYMTIDGMATGQILRDTGHVVTNGTWQAKETGPQVTR